MIVSMIVLISCSVHDNEDGKTNENFGVIKKISLILEYGRDSVVRPSSNIFPIKIKYRKHFHQLNEAHCILKLSIL